jgi:hypothetical protein
MRNRFIVSSEGRESHQPQVIRASHTNSKILVPEARTSRTGNGTATTAPLALFHCRWEPFRRSAYMRKRHEVLKPEDKKFFQALIKPKAYNSHLESFRTADKNTGAVFRALPVYRVRFDLLFFFIFILFYFLLSYLILFQCQSLMCVKTAEINKL